MAKGSEKKTTGIGVTARELILAGKTNAEVLTAIQKKYPESKANSGTIGWYRNKLKKDGKKVKDSRAIMASNKKVAAKAAKAAAIETSTEDPAS